LYGYYRGFGLSIDSLSFSADNVLIHSVPVITSPCFWITAICTAAVLLAVGVCRIGRAVISNPLFALLLILISGILSSRYANGLGRANAYRDARLPTTTLPYVTLQADSAEAEVTGCSTAESNFRLLLRSGGEVFVVLPVDTDTAPNLRVCVFPENHIKTLRIQVGLAGR
jgi:hypothetical protein